MDSNVEFQGQKGAELGLPFSPDVRYTGVTVVVPRTVSQHAGDSRRLWIRASIRGRSRRCGRSIRHVPSRS
jgi:hypothetical protein